MTVLDRAEEGLLSVKLAVQRSRAMAFVGMYVVAMVGKLAGLLDFNPLSAHALLVSTLASAALFHQLYSRRLDRRWGIDLKIVWMACDVGFITWLMVLTHGASSLWMVWYLSNTAAAAFVAGRPAALGVAIANSTAYLTLLIVLGDIRGFDRGLADAMIHLALLYSASFFFLRGIADLRDKRHRIRELARVKSQQLEELKELTAKLDRQATELAQAHLESQEASRSKSQFLANMSHELRTPLNSIIGFSEILGDKLSDTLEPRYLKFLANILDAGRHLLSLINDILDLSKIEAGKMELILEKVSLGDIAQGVRSVMLGVVGGRGIAIVIEMAEDLPLLVGDGPKVKQILYNLVSNAIKFSPDHSEVRIEALPLEDGEGPLSGPSVELRVIDQGIGIAAVDQETIFQEFRQVDGESTRAHGGTGLGLALVRRFAEMHGGLVAVDSIPGQGSTFRVWLPADASQVMLTPGAGSAEARVAERVEALVAEPAESLVADSGPVVMVVEDDELFYRALAADLERAGYRTFWARAGEEALRRIAEVRPAAITLDLALPGMDGWEVLKALKDDPAAAHVPVIIVSLLENHELGFALGAEDYFLKPLERRVFLERLRELLGDARSPRSSRAGSSRAGSSRAGSSRAAVRPALIIDDDPQVHEILEQELIRAGYEVLAAHDGQRGLELARVRRPAIVVLDLMMPQMNGFEVATQLREDPRTAGIPIVVLTSKELSSRDRQRLQGKIEGLLSKAPMDRKWIVQSLKRIEQRAQAQHPRRSES